MFSEATPRHGSVLSISTSGFHRIAYTEWGDPKSDRVAMCVHGLTRQGRDFDPLAIALARHGYRVVCPDLAGRGRSDWLMIRNIRASPICPGYDDRAGPAGCAASGLDRHVARRVGRHDAGGPGKGANTQDGHQRYRALSAVGRAASDRLLSAPGARNIFRTINRRSGISGRSWLPSAARRLRLAFADRT